MVVGRIVATMCAAKRSWMVSLLLCGVLWVGGCQSTLVAPTSDQPDPSPTFALGRQPAAPTLTDSATLISEPAVEFYPPRIVAYAPLPGEVMPADGTLYWTFDQDMDRESIAAGLHITPLPDGDFVWLSDRKVTFVPTPADSPSLSPGMRYSVIIDAAQVRSTAGIPMSHDALYTFSVLSPLQVTRVLPVEGASDLRGDTPILVAFSHEMVPDVCIGRDAAASSECPALPLVFSPAVRGGGTWVNTSLYRYEVLGGFVSGAVHEVVLDGGVMSLDGAVLAEPFSWSFEVAVPQVLSVSPEAGDQAVALDADLRVVFNTPMDAQTTGSALRVVDDSGEPVAGAITWRDNGAEMVFSPIRLLDSDTVYLVQVGERARATRSMPLAFPPSWGFRTVPTPELLSHTPADADAEVALDTPVRISFAGAIDVTSLQAGIVVSSALGLENVFSTYDAEVGVATLMWDRLPRTEYCVAVTDALVDIYGVPLLRPLDFCFVTGDLPTVLTSMSDVDVMALTSDLPSVLRLTALNVTSAAFVLSEVTVPAVTGTESDGGEILREWSEVFDLEPNTVTPVTLTLRRLGGALPTGLYQLGWQLPGDTASARRVSLAVVDRHVTVKLSDSEAVVWVADLTTGAPVTRTEVQLLNAEGMLIAGGTTDADGLVRLPRASGPGMNGGGLGDVLAAVTGQPGEAGFGFALMTSRSAAMLWKFGVHVDLGPWSPYWASVYTDRSIYHPGQRVQIAGFAREVLGGVNLESGIGESVTADSQITLTLKGPGGAVIDRYRLRLSETGRIDAALYLSESLPVGVYRVEVESTAMDLDAGTVLLATVPITVVHKERAGLAIRVLPERADLVAGTQARFVVQVDAGDGRPASGASLAWTITAGPHEFTMDTGPASAHWVWQSQQDHPIARVVATGTAVTDGNGRYVIEVPAALAPATDAVAGAEVWRVEAVVLDGHLSSDVVAVGTGALIVHGSEYYIGLFPKSRVVRVRERLAIDLQMVDWVGLGIGEQEIQVQLHRRAWVQRPEDGAWVHSDTMVSEQIVTTNGSGLASAAFTAPRSGPYVVKAMSVDDEGRETRDEVCLWVGGSENGDGLLTNTEVTLIADQLSYRSGDVAKVLVPAPFEEPYGVLLTVERDGILAVQRFAFDAPNPIIEVPMPAAYSPNVYVSCIVLRPGDDTRAPQVYVGYLNVPVDSPEHKLTVEVIPTATNGNPDNNAEVLIRTLDHTGQPVSADVILSVTEETPIHSAGDDVPWLGYSFAGDRYLRVLTGDALLVPGASTSDEPSSMSCMLSSRDESQPRVLALGQETMVQGAIYRELDVHTDRDGETVAGFDLPGLPTGWHVTAWALTEDGATGQGEAMLSTEMPLSVWTLTPPYFVSGDHSEIEALVRNGTDEDLVVDVGVTAVQGLIVEGITVQRISISAGLTKRVVWQVTASGARTAMARVEARSDDHVAVAEITDSVAGSVGVPIRYLTPMDGIAFSAVLGTTAQLTEVIDVPASAGESTQLVVRIDATLDSFLARALADGAHSMALAEPDVTAVWVETLISTLSSYRALSVTEHESAVTESAVEAIHAALDRIYAWQNGDGGWGWASASGSFGSDFCLTSDVAFALLRARGAGFPLRENVLEDALTWLTDVLDEAVTAGARYGDLAFAMRVLSEAQRPWPQGISAVLYADRDDLGVSGRAHLALALGLVDASDTRVTTLLGELQDRALADMSGMKIHWEELGRANRKNSSQAADVLGSVVSNSVWDLHPRGTHVQATALALEALVTLAPDAEEIPGAVKWLMGVRQGLGWQTPYETSWVLNALADYVCANPRGAATPTDLGAEETLGGVVRLNGVEVLSTESSSQDAAAGFAPSLLLGLTNDTTAAPALRTGRNVLEIAHTSASSPDTGEAPIYVSIHLDSVLRTVEGAASDGRGLSLSRRYCALPDSTERLTEWTRAACAPISSAGVGGKVVVRLLVTVPEVRYAVMLEDLLPAGFRVVEAVPSVSGDTRLGEVPLYVSSPEAFRWVRSHEGRVVFFAPELPPGTYEVEYVMVAVYPGTYTALPATVREMYFADTVARTAVVTLPIVPDQEGR